ASGFHRPLHLLALHVYCFAGGIQLLLDLAPRVIERVRDGVGHVGRALLGGATHAHRPALDIATRRLARAWREEEREPRADGQTNEQRDGARRGVPDYHVTV